MAGWTLLVWLAVGAVLGPLSSLLLGAEVLRSERRVVGNEELLAWLLTPRGLTYAALAGGLALTGAVVRYAGLFRIVTDDLEGRAASVRRTALRLATQLPTLYRLSVSLVLAAGALLLPLLLTLLAIRATLIAEHDINYYLAARPPAWRHALLLAGGVAGAWTLGAAWLAGRLALALPAYIDGHRPIAAAVRRAWTRSAGRGSRLTALMALSIAAWLLGRVAVDATYLALAGATVEGLAAAGTGVRPLVLATGVFLAGSLALDAVVGFLGFSYAATLLTKFYYEKPICTPCCRRAPLAGRCGPARSPPCAAGCARAAC